MWRDYYYEVTKEGWHRAPLSRDYPFYVIFQAEGSDPGTDDARFERVLTGAFEDGMIVDAVLGSAHGLLYHVMLQYRDEPQ